jgi:protein transport protein SEC23
MTSSKVWSCPFCATRNPLPAHYGDISAHNRPPETLPQHTTIEYIVDPTERPPVFVFVIDTSIIAEELAALKQALLESLMLLPDNALVGLIAFGSDVHVYELAFKAFPKSYCIRGTADPAEVRLPAAAAALPGTAAGARPEQKGPDGLAAPSTGAPANTAAGRSRFFLPFSECDAQITAILEDMSRDRWPVERGMRQDRCTGTAIAVALRLLETSHKAFNARVMLFVGGAPTTGPGAVVPRDLKTPIRSHKEIERDEAPLLAPATEFYNKMAAQAGVNGHAIDLFVACLDQVGVVEMQSMVTRTGGHIVLDDSFTRGVFQGSLRRIFAVDPDDEDNLTMAFGAETMVVTSKELRVQGASGHLISLQRKSPSVADSVVGVGGTCAWRLGALDHTSTTAFFLEMSATSAPAAAAGAADAPPPAQQAYLQIATRYRHPTGRTHLRVTTLAKPMRSLDHPQGHAAIRVGFDQEAAAVLMTRYVLTRTESETPLELMRLLDRILIRFASKFGKYTKDDPNSFSLAPELAFYPQFMFHLRRSQFLQLFNNSPDETAFHRAIGSRENTANTLVMIQPTLMAYSLSGPAEPAALDVSAMDSQRILLLDTFFHIVIWYGDTINRWRQAKMHENPQHAHLAQLLRAPVQDAKALMAGRFPSPRFIECVEKGSQARFLLVKLDPSSNNASQSQSFAGGDPAIHTEDVSLKKFLAHLKKVAVVDQN